MKTEFIKHEKHSARACSTKSEKECIIRLSAIEDALYVIGGKWKLKIITSLRIKGNMRFNELQRTIGGISARVLSNELKDLELNGFLKRNIYTQAPVVIEYELTDYSDTLTEVLEKLVQWGTKHRAKIRRELTTK
jgi:DNA-binding HxlR family transcriptional regulator